MAVLGTALLPSPIGEIGLAWTASGLAALLLPGATPAATQAVLTRRFGRLPEAVPPPAVQQAMQRIVALLGGEHDDLASVAIDLDGVDAFARRVWTAARGIGPGQTITYGELAARIGEPGAARAVGRSLGANRLAVVVPCHRVLPAGGGVGGFSAPGGLRTKLRLLEIEQARFGASPGLFDGA